MSELTTSGRVDVSRRTVPVLAINVKAALAKSAQSAVACETSPKNGQWKLHEFRGAI